jgi:hypothetical protein
LASAAEVVRAPDGAGVGARRAPKRPAKSPATVNVKKAATIEEGTTPPARLRTSPPRVAQSADPMMSRRL